MFSGENNTRGSTYSNKKKPMDNGEGRNLVSLLLRLQKSNNNINWISRTRICKKLYELDFFYCCTMSTDRLIQLIDRSTYDVNRQNFGKFSIFSLRNGIIVCLNRPYNWLVSLYCTVLTRNSPKKERLCFKIVLGPAWFELYCTVIFLPCTHLMEVWIGRASPP